MKEGRQEEMREGKKTYKEKGDEEIIIGRINRERTKERRRKRTERTKGKL